MSLLPIDELLGKRWRGSRRTGIRAVALKSRPPEAACRGWVGGRAEAAAGSARVAAAVILAALVSASLSRAAQAATKAFNFTVERKHVDVGSGMTYNAWTYNGTVPGPILRIDQGDQVSIQLINDTTDAHGINIHAAQMPPTHFSGDPRTRVSYGFRAEVPGVFVYHCNAVPILDHIAAGMYGMTVVEPKGGWPGGSAQEINIVQSEFYGLPDKHGLISGDHAKMLDARADFVVFNGQLNKYGLQHPIPVKTGRLVRLFFVNAGPNLTSAFHIAGVIFSTIYRGGNPADALHGIDALDVGPSQGAVFEFTLKEPGDYRIMDMQRAHQYKGALGILRATP